MVGVKTLRIFASVTLLLTKIKEMGIKSLFFTDTENDVKKPESKETNKFPVTNPTSTTFPIMETQTQPVFGNSLDNPILNKFVEAYENCLDSANQDGYDFYEFFKAIINSGAIENPQMYVMAMNMGIVMDKTCNKSKLLSQADYYLNEINKLYNQNVTSGSSKKQDLITQKDSENHNLSAELNNLRAQVEALQNQISAKQTQLLAIDSKYQPLINEIEQKLQANDIAKNTIVSNIDKVKNGINNNIK